MERVVFKVSGEALKVENASIHHDKLEIIYQSVQLLKKFDKQIILIPGGGNLWRGRNNQTMRQSIADSIGMMATMMNGLALYDYLCSKKEAVYLCSAFGIDGMIDKYNIMNCLHQLENGKIVIVSGGVGLPYTTTDFACVQRAIELDADYILMGKNIDGVYDKDPRKYKDAYKYDTITHDELLDIQRKNGLGNLGVMDNNALSLLCEHRINAYLYQVDDKEALPKILSKKKSGTLITSQK